MRLPSGGSSPSARTGPLPPTPSWPPRAGAAAADTDTGGGTEAGGDSSAGFRTYGKGKDHRDGLPQVVIGMAVTREGIPVRVWSWPGNTSDSALIRQVKADLKEWTLSRVIWVA